MLRLFLTGYFDRGNFGDDLMHSALRQFLEKHRPEVRMVSRSLPRFHPLSIRAMPSFLGALLWCDSIALAGGSHFHDGYGLRSYRLLSTFLGLFVLAKLLRKHVLLIGVGVGPLSGRVPRLLTKAIVLLADVVLVRDAESAAIARSLASKKDVLEGIDLAGLLAADNLPQTGCRAANGNTFRVGFSVVPYFKSYQSSAHLDEAFAESCVRALEAAAKSRSPFEVTLMVFSVKGSDADTAIIAGLERRIRSSTSADINVRTIVCNDLQSVLELMKTLDIVIASRYHALWLSYIAQRPTIIVNYHDKCSSLADQLEFAEASRVTPEQVLSGRLEDILTLATKEPGRFVSTVSPREIEKRAESGLLRALDVMASSRGAA